MKYAALNYVKIAGQLYGRGEVIPGEILTDEQKGRLIRLNAIACVDGDEEVIMPEPEVMSDDEAPEIDIMAGIVTEPEKTPAKPKTGGRSRKKS